MKWVIYGLMTMCFACTVNNHATKKISLFKKNTSLELKEGFERLNKRIWNYQQHSFPENGCEMRASQVKADQSLLQIEVIENPVAGEKQCLGGEISTRRFFQYGKFTARIKNDLAPGCVSGFFLMNQFSMENWEHKEIDIEFLGKNQHQVQFTVHDFQDGGKKHVSYPYLHDLGFDSSLDFHDYTIEWHPEYIAWYVDGKKVYQDDRILLSDKMRIRLNQYAGEQSDDGVLAWLGKLDKTQLPSTVYCDDIIYEPLLDGLKANN